MQGVALSSNDASRLAQICDQLGDGARRIIVLTAQLLLFGLQLQVYG
jgi:hypothetical protein